MGYFLVYLMLVAAIFIVDNKADYLHKRLNKLEQQLVIKQTK